MSLLVFKNIKKENDYKQIEEDIINLKQSFDILHELVSEQQPQIDMIEDFIMLSKESTKEAYVELKKAETYTYSYNIKDYVCYISGFFAIGLILLLKK